MERIQVLTLITSALNVSRDNPDALYCNELEKVSANMSRTGLILEMLDGSEFNVTAEAI